MATKKLISEPQQILLAWPLQKYEEESEYFFEDKSMQLIADDTLARLLIFPNVLITSSILHTGSPSQDSTDNLE